MQLLNRCLTRRCGLELGAENTQLTSQHY
jgi:hypothetical protein